MHHETFHEEDISIFNFNCFSYFYFRMWIKSRKTIKKFEDAYNKGDLKTVIDCFEPTTAKAINASISLVGGFLGVDLSAVMDLIPFMYKLADKQKNTSEIPHITLKILGEKQEKDRAIVYVEATLKEGRKKEVENMEFVMIKVDGEWYIEDVK
ncbi:MAG TPA: DUF4878 domain-containing protein [Clostridia bacterium]|nr:DUF4878 domain-containing protein [Clostridia bacterium]